MKISLSVLIFFFIISCKSDDKDSLYCNVENPIEDLDWLRIEINEAQFYYDSIEVIKMEMPSFGEIGYLFQHETPVPNQVRSEYYYTCNGTLICYNLGGFTGTNCNGKWDDLILGDIVYQSF